MTPRIVIDPGGLDVSTPQGGQFRYVIDLIRGLRQLNPPAEFIVLGGAPKPVTELAEVLAGGSAWKYVPFLRPNKRGAMYVEQIRLTSALFRTAADLYHSLHTTLPVMAPCPVMTTVYDLMYELFPEYASARRSRPFQLFKWGVRHRARRAICISQTTADDVARLWRVSETRLPVVYLGRQLTDHTGGGKSVGGIDGGRPFILSPYNLEPRKNLIALLLAFARITPKQRPRLVLYGRAGLNPERENQFVHRARELGIWEDIQLAGFVSEAQLTWLYQQAEVFVFPSLYEGFGYPVLEAMAAGVCVITRRGSAMAEVVGPCGLLVETAEWGELATALEWLLVNPSERDRLRTMGIDRAREFSIRRMAEQTWQVYLASLGPRNR